MRQLSLKKDWCCWRRKCKRVNSLIAGNTLSTGHPVSQIGQAHTHMQLHKYVHTQAGIHTHPHTLTGMSIKYSKTSHVSWNISGAAAYTLPVDLEYVRGLLLEVSPPALFTHQCNGNEWYDGRKERDEIDPLHPTSHATKRERLKRKKGTNKGGIARWGWRGIWLFPR